MPTSMVARSVVPVIGTGAVATRATRSATIVTPTSAVLLPVPLLPVALLNSGAGDAGHARDSQAGCRTDRNDLHTGSFHPRTGLTEADEPQTVSGPTRLGWAPGGERPKWFQ
jgi:hypothetical protein